MTIILNIILPLVLTIIVEFAVLVLLGEVRDKILYSSIGVNILTNPTLNILLVDSELSNLIIGESIVFVVEAIWYICFGKKIKETFIYSGLCNVISFFSGVMLFFFVSIFADLKDL